MGSYRNWSYDEELKTGVIMGSYETGVIMGCYLSYCLVLLQLSLAKRVCFLF